MPANTRLRFSINHYLCAPQMIELEPFADQPPGRSAADIIAATAMVLRS